MRRDLIRHSQQVVVHGVRIRIDLQRLFERRNPVLVFPPPHIDQSQSAVGHRQRLILRGRKGFIGQVLGLRERWRNFDGLLGKLFRFGQHLHGSGLGCAATQGSRQRLPQQRERRDVVRYQRDFLYAVFLHLLRSAGLQVGIGQRHVHRRFVAALGIFQEKCFTCLDLFRGITRIHGLKGLVRRIFFRTHRRRRVRRKRCSLRRLRFVAVLRRRLALASLAILRGLRGCDSTPAHQQSRDGCRSQPDIPVLSHPFSPLPFLLHSRFTTQNRRLFKAALSVYLRQTPRGLFAPPVLPAPARLPRSARTDTPSSLLRDFPHHRKSVRGKRATTPAPWDLESPHVRRRSGARIPAWPLPHRDPGAPPIQFHTTPAPHPDISSELFETMPLPRADFSPRSAAPLPSAP